ncbi:hypothetical protein BJV77DRAFT_659630 [Russula vinacea]|nr:hypothetical protein BJV77DRAFT_659630 [Russula vinacea]
MHELLAPLYYAVDYDSLPDTSDPDDLTDLCARKWVAADAWVLFDRVMGGSGQWYEWREAPQWQVPAVAGLVHLNGQGGIEPYLRRFFRRATAYRRNCSRASTPFCGVVCKQRELNLRCMGCKRFPRFHLPAVADWKPAGCIADGCGCCLQGINMHDAMVLWDGMFAVDPSLEMRFGFVWPCSFEYGINVRYSYKCWHKLTDYSNPVGL